MKEWITRLLTKSRDAKEQDFAYVNLENGRHKKLLRVLADESTAELGCFSYDGNTPTSDGAVSWTLDGAGRVATVSGHEVTVCYEYQHPLGVMTRKRFGSTDLSYAYDTSGYLQTLSDSHSNAVTYTRTPGGVLSSALYSSGIVETYGYTAQLYVSDLTYSKSGTVLASFHAEVDGLGRRHSLAIQPTEEYFSYGYDSEFRLSSATRTLNAVASTTSYTHDVVGNRVTRTTAAGTEAYHYDAGYKLNSISGVGSQTVFGYDANGNTTSKVRQVEGLLTIYYKNRSGADRTYTLNGQRVVFAATGEEEGFRGLEVPAGLGAKVALTLLPEDVDPSALIEVEKVYYTSEEGTATLGMDVAEYGGSVAAVTDADADDSLALAFGGASDDVIRWTTGLPESERVDYTWDALNRLTDVVRRVNSEPLHSATLVYGAMGWQARSESVHHYTNNTDDSRVFGFGYGGELLSEQTGGWQREYVNGSLDHALWTYESPMAAGGTDQTRYWLRDVNGSVFGIASEGGVVVERQRFDEFGKREVTGADGTLVVASTLDNRTGYEGLSGLDEFGLNYGRNRWADTSTGRFLSRDPLGLEGGGAAWYLFAHHDPVNGSDPWGLDDDPPKVKQKIVGGFWGPHAVDMTPEEIEEEKNKRVPTMAELVRAVARDNKAGLRVQKVGPAVAAAIALPAAAAAAGTFGAVDAKLHNQDPLEGAVDGAATVTVAAPIAMVPGGATALKVAGVGLGAAGTAQDVKDGNYLGAGVRAAATLAALKVTESPNCFTAGTPILTADGYKPIESLRVGQRVMAERNSNFATGVNEKEWRKITLRIPDPNKAGEQIEVELLRPLLWIGENHCEVGGSIRFVMLEMGLDCVAQVKAILPCPSIETTRWARDFDDDCRVPHGHSGDQA